MDEVDPARLSLVLSLALLGLSLAAFVSVTGLVPASATGPAGTFSIEDGTFTFSAGGSETAIVEETEPVGRIEITADDGRFTTATELRDSARLTDAQRDIAKRTALTNDTLADRLEAAGGAELTVVPVVGAEVPERWDGLTRDGAATGVNRDSPRGNGTGDGFELSANDPAGSVVLHRDEPTVLEDRAIVIVDPVTESAKYRVTVDLASETVRRILRLEFVAD
ncbi:hypothetical protein [Halopiger djelfimassiliensis]|uniref:hypothetical protein n=1 Tax=Halopiger djelfimassiliensis TaxID=1293047 RepID=UPI000ACA4186|nr:hypothetical protein [Halopiger djelfimassiliensis]